MINDEIAKATDGYPRFPDGRIDYTNSRICFTVNCVIVHENRVLLAQRARNSHFYPNKFNGISGFIDDANLSIESIARNELSEEIGLPASAIKRIRIYNKPLVETDNEINREWHVFAVLVELKYSFSPRINPENQAAVWFEIDQIKKLELTPGFAKIVNVALNLRKIK